MIPYVRRLLEQCLFEPLNHFTGCQGKRIRGLLLQLSYELAGGAGQVAPTISEAIESLHAGSLIIDDIQDDSQTRRGQLTMHHEIGVPLAINAGNWMYFHALECLSDVPLPAEQHRRLVTAMIRTARQCHEGQAIDLHARIDRVPTAHWPETTLAISTLKTGALVALAVEMGCMAADPQSKLSFVLPKFGRQIGIALQMRNDLDELAKLAHSRHACGATEAIRDDDLRNLRLTWPWVWACESLAGEQCRWLAQRAGSSRQDSYEVAQELFEIVGGVGEESIRALIREQLRLLGEHVIDGRWIDSLHEILEPIERQLETAKKPDHVLTNSTPGDVMP